MFIYPSGNLSHPPHDYLTNGYYYRWVDPTETYPPVPDTALSMIASQKILWCDAMCHSSRLGYLHQISNTPTVAIYNSDKNLRLKFSINFISLVHLLIHLMKLVFDSWHRGVICNSWIVSNQIISRFESIIVSNYVLNRSKANSIFGRKSSEPII